MKRRSQMTTLLHQNRIILVSSPHFGRWTGALDDRRSDENRFQVLVEAFRMESCNAAVQLPAIAVTLNADVHQPQGFLHRIADVGRQQDGARPGTEYSPALAEPGDRLKQVLLLKQLHHGGALAAWNDQAVHIL